MKKNNLKIRNVKNFSVKLACTVLSRDEFGDIYQYYYFIGSSATPLKVDNLCDCRVFYRIGSYSSIVCMYPDVTYEYWSNLPSFVCVEDVMEI